jgi:hypothetical protein
MKIRISNSSIKVEYKPWSDIDVSNEVGTPSAGYYFGNVGNNLNATTSGGNKYPGLDLSDYIGHRAYVKWSNSSSTGRYSAMCDLSQKIGEIKVDADVANGVEFSITDTYNQLYLSAETTVTGIQVIIKE